MNWDLVVIFTFVIVLTIVRAHYRRQEGGGGAMGAGEQAALSGAMEQARRLESRIETLERLLDEDAPGWRARVRA
jgi:phage shock protein B